MNTLNYIKELVKLHPAINYVGVGDVFDLNSISNVQYPAIWIELESAEINLESVDPTFRLFYIDRLLDDKSNALDVQTDSMYILNQILYSLADAITVEVPLRITPYQQRFNDMCAGAYVDVPVNECTLQDIAITIPVSTPMVFGYWNESDNMLTPKNPLATLDASFIANLPKSDISTLELETSRKINTNCYSEFVTTGGNITQINYWTSSAKTLKLFEKVITYDGSNNVTQIVMTDLQTSKALTTTIAYSGSDISNITKIES